MKLNVIAHKHCDLVEITGRIDSYSTPQIEEALKTLITDDHYNIIVDFRKVTFISSSGILTFVGTQRKLTQNELGEIVFIHMPEIIYQSFEIAGFDTVFEFFNDLSTALDWF